MREHATERTNQSSRPGRANEAQIALH